MASRERNREDQELSVYWPLVTSFKFAPVMGIFSEWVMGEAREAGKDPLSMEALVSAEEG